MQAYELPYFRAAVIEKTKRQSDLFHNHLTDDQVMYRYPLIQYKITDRKASLVCLAEATEDIHYLLKQQKFDFQIGNRPVQMEIEDVRLKFEQIQTQPSLSYYNMQHWMALNQEHYKAFRDLTDIPTRKAYLENILHSHLSTFLQALGNDEPYPLKTQILEVKSEKYIEYKGIFQITFSLNFATNLHLPNYIGLGKGVSVGFGNVKRINDPTAFKEKQHAPKRSFFS